MKPQLFSLFISTFALGLVCTTGACHWFGRQSSSSQSLTPLPPLQASAAASASGPEQLEPLPPGPLYSEPPLPLDASLPVASPSGAPSGPEDAGASAQLAGDSGGVSDAGPGPMVWTDEHPVRIKYFRNVSGGSCALPPLPHMYIAAVPRAIYRDQESCGGCIEVKGPSGAVVVQIADLCHGCAPDVIDLSTQAYWRVAGDSRTIVRATWKLVACPVEGPLQYRFKEGSSQYWTAFQVRNHRYPLRSIEWRKGNGPWTPLSRSADNHFVVEGGVGTQPFVLRLTSALGQQLEQPIPEYRAGQMQEGAGQFPLQ